MRCAGAFVYLFHEPTEKWHDAKNCYFSRWGAFADLPEDSSAKGMFSNQFNRTAGELNDTFEDKSTIAKSALPERVQVEVPEDEMRHLILYPGPVGLGIKKRPGIGIVVVSVAPGGQSHTQGLTVGARVAAALCRQPLFQALPWAPRPLSLS
jgi:hypothetical protein